MNLEHKKIGIWGLGVVGKAALKTLHRTNTVSVMDQRPLTDDETALLARCNARFYSQQQQTQFFADHDVILPSPGIDLRPYKDLHHLFISELDVFFTHCPRPIIAITGTVGKTTITSLLAQVLSHAGYKVCVGGNIGVGMLELIDQAQESDYIVLEVSSFQLELCKVFAPYLALWTNFYPNHLDRHSSLEEYFVAKQNIFMYQKKNAYAVMPVAVNEQLTISPAALQILFTTQATPPAHTDTVYIRDGYVMQQQGENHEAVLPVKQIPTATFIENSLAILAACKALNIATETFQQAAATFVAHEHRLEHVATVRGVDVYNDSKATISQATLAAVEKLQGKPVVLLLGGLSKGVDRTQMFYQLHGKVKAIVCFGKEAHSLHMAGTQAGITCRAVTDVAAAIQSALSLAQPGEQILFSPAGSSFDLFKNYQERGTHFKKLVRLYEK